jgi:hypothetical protein
MFSDRQFALNSDGIDRATRQLGNMEDVVQFAVVCTGTPRLKAGESALFRYGIYDGLHETCALLYRTTNALNAILVRNNSHLRSD